MASFAHNLRRTRYFIMYCSSSRYSFPHLTFCLGVALFCFCLFFPSPLFATYRRRSIRKLCPFTSSSRCVPLLYYTCTFVSCDVSGLRMSRFSYPVRVTCGVFFSVWYFATTELEYLGRRISTGTGCAGCRGVDTVSCEAHT